MKIHCSLQRLLPLLFASAVLAVASSSSSSSVLLSVTSTKVKSTKQQQHVMTPRIVGGLPTLSDAYPWFAASTGRMLCGATLVERNLLLTAAHCASAFAVGSSVVIGADRRFVDSTNTTYATNSSSSSTSNSNPTTVYYRTVNATKIHENYNPMSLKNDILLIQLDQDLPDTVPLVQLNTDPNVPPTYYNYNYSSSSSSSTSDTNYTLTTIGFGRTMEKGSLSESLQQVDLDWVSYHKCSLQYNRVVGSDGKTKIAINETTMLCASRPGNSACQGDSGGPMVVQQQDFHQTPMQVGIVSFGVGCARKDYSGVYTRVSAFGEWIAQGVCELGSAAAWASFSSSSVRSSQCERANATQPARDDDKEGEEQPLLPEEPSQNEESDKEPTDDKKPKKDKKDKKKKDEKQDTNSDNLARLRVQFAYDSDADGTLWTVSQGDTIHYVGPDYEATAFDLWNTTIQGMNNGKYNFTVYDNTCDGLGVGGFFRILLLLQSNNDSTENDNGDDSNSDEQELILISGGRNFHDCYMIVPFEINTTSTTDIAAPCQDTPAGFDVVDVSDTESHDCAWLAANQAYHDVLCQWKDVAAACPVTCHACN